MFAGLCVSRFAANAFHVHALYDALGLAAETVNSAAALFGDAVMA